VTIRIGQRVSRGGKTGRWQGYSGNLHGWVQWPDAVKLEHHAIDDLEVEAFVRQDEPTVSIHNEPSAVRGMGTQ